MKRVCDLCENGTVHSVIDIGITNTLCYLWCDYCGTSYTGHPHDRDLKNIYGIEKLIELHMNTIEIRPSKAIEDILEVGVNYRDDITHVIWNHAGYIFRCDIPNSDIENENMSGDRLTKKDILDNTVIMSYLDDMIRLEKL